MSTEKFIRNLGYELINSISNNYSDNYDHYRFGKENFSNTSLARIKNSIKGLLNRIGFYESNSLNYLAEQIKSEEFPVTDFAYLYDILNDEGSKNLLIKIIAYRMLGYRKVKLPLNTPEFWQNQKTIKANQSKNDFVEIDFMKQKLPLTDLSFLGIPIKMYYSVIGINIDFIVKQYEFHCDIIDIEVIPGDYVIDAGGCFGDTALYFANKTGGTGKVKVFEFIPGNIELLNKNVKLNPELEPIIELIEHPVWNESGKEVFYISNGPGSKVSLDYFNEHTGKTTTLSIDDYVRSSGLTKVDFIKMDIEGAEFSALDGSIQTIRNFRPKLAIALYHGTKDFDRIPRFLNDLDLGYKFYLLHATIYGEETMLFATTER